jgi:uncharacterized membrane protein YgdD (TMEM256/DUF423 family)
MNWNVAGALLMAAAVALGAFGAHGLRARLDAYSMGVYEKAVFYHFIHALGILLAARVPLACWLFLAGIALFSGSLYLLAVTGNRSLGAITPIGGVCFIAAWIVLAFRSWGKG